MVCRASCGSHRGRVTSAGNTPEGSQCPPGGCGGGGGGFCVRQETEEGGREGGETAGERRASPGSAGDGVSETDLGGRAAGRTLHQPTHRVAHSPMSLRTSRRRAVPLRRHCTVRLRPYGQRLHRHWTA